MGEAIDDTLEKVEAHTAQVTTDAYAGVPESHLKAYGKNRIDYWLANEDASNGITGKVQGRYTQGSGGAAGAWQDVGAEVAVGTETAAKLATLTDLEYDEYRVAVKATSGGSQGDARVYGGARLAPPSPVESQLLEADATVGSETSDDVDVTIQTNIPEAKLVHVELFEGDQDASGAMTEAATAAFTLTDGGAGSIALGASTREAVFLTDATGQAVATVTDVAGGSGLAVIGFMREGSKNGRFLGAFVAQFD